MKTITVAAFIALTNISLCNAESICEQGNTIGCVIEKASEGYTELLLSKTKLLQQKQPEQEAVEQKEEKPIAIALPNMYDIYIWSDQSNRYYITANQSLLPKTFKSLTFEKSHSSKQYTIILEDGATFKSYGAPKVILKKNYRLVGIR